MPCGHTCHFWPNLNNALRLKSMHRLDLFVKSMLLLTGAKSALNPLIKLTMLMKATNSDYTLILIKLCQQFTITYFASYRRRWPTDMEQTRTGAFNMVCPLAYPSWNRFFLKFGSNISKNWHILRINLGSVQYAHLSFGLGHNFCMGTYSQFYEWASSQQY